MRNTASLHWTLLVALIALPVAATAQNSIDDQESVALHNPVISGDGVWMAAEERSDRGDGNVRVWSTEGDVAFTIERGQHPRISRDSRWVSALQRPPLKDSGTVTPTNNRAGQTLVLLDTQDGSQRTFEFVLSHDWTYSYDGTYTSMHLVYLQSGEMEADEDGPSKDEATKPATKPAAKEREVGTLHLIHMTGEGEDRMWRNVTEFAAYERSRYVAYVVHDCQDESHDHDETGRDSLHIAGFSAWNTGIQGVYDGEKIEGLCWARDRPMLRFLDSTETTGNDGKRRVNSALYTWQRDDDNPSLGTIFTQVNRGDSELGALHNPVISGDGAWMAAEERSDRGDGNVRVWSTEGDVTFTIERGQNPRISRDSRWVSALQKPLNEPKADEPRNERAGRTLVLLDTQDGSQRTFDFVLSHDWTYFYDETYTSMHLVYLQSGETEADEDGPSKDEATKPATKPAAKEREVGTLHLVHLTGEGDDGVWRNVTEFAVYERRRVVAYVVHDCQDESHDHDETVRDSLHIVGFSAWNSGLNAIYDGEKIEGLCWARDRLTLGLLDSTETTGNDGTRRVNSTLYAWPGRPAYDTTQPLARRWRQGFTRVDTPAQGLLDDVSAFAEEVLGERLRVHFTEYKRGDLGVDALFESEDLIGYTTFSNDLYRKVPSPVELKDCILFAASYKDQKSAEAAFHHLKANSVIRASEVEGMVGPTPVQVRFLERIRNDGDGGLFTQQGSYVFFLTENGEEPPLAANWKDYGELFLASIAGDDESMETIRLREGPSDR